MGFFKADHEAAYEQIPMIPEHANLAFVAIRDPLTSRGWPSIRRLYCSELHPQFCTTTVFRVS